MSSTNRGSSRKSFDDYPTPTDAIDLFLEAAPPSLLRAGRWLEPCAGKGTIIERVNLWRSRTNVPHFVPEWHAWEIQEKYKSPLSNLGLYCTDNTAAYMLTQNVQLGDCLKLAKNPPAQYFDVAITNPPYNEAMPILLALRRIAHTVVLLLRRNFIGSAGRAEYLRNNMPDEYLLPKRPSFVWRHTYHLRCRSCARDVRLTEDVPAGQAPVACSYVHPRQTDHCGPKTLRVAQVSTTKTDSCEYCWCVWTPESGPVGSTRMLALKPTERS